MTFFTAQWTQLVFIQIKIAFCWPRKKSLLFRRNKDTLSAKSKMLYFKEIMPPGTHCTLDVWRQKLGKHHNYLWMFEASVVKICVLERLRKCVSVKGGHLEKFQLIINYKQSVREFQLTSCFRCQVNFASFCMITSVMWKQLRHFDFVMNYALFTQLLSALWFTDETETIFFSDY